MKLVDRVRLDRVKVDRVKRILLSPRTEWAVIDAERATPAALYTGYIAPLAAIGPVAQLIGNSVLGNPTPFGVRERAPFGSALLGAILSYALMLAGTYLLALIIDALAPTFSAQRSKIQALKLAAYSLTAVWLAGTFALIPELRPLGLLSLYSLFLLYVGLPVLMKPAGDKTLPYTVVVVVAGFVLFLIIGSVAGRFTGIPHAWVTMP